MRKLKFHEQKLLKKVNLFKWKSDNNFREAKIMRRYHLNDRDDYEKYNKICGLITSLVSKLNQLTPDDKFRIIITDQILEKLYNLGLINQKENIIQAQKIPVSAFCRRRLPIIMQEQKFSETLKEATTFIQHGHVRIGTEVVTEPALLVSRTMEDHIAWVDNSKIKKAIMQYKDKLDDYDMLE